MGVIIWDKPERAMTTEEWSSLSADGAPPGVFVRNETKDASQKWWGKVLGTRNPPLRAVLRYTTSNYVYLKVVVYTNGLVRISANGTAELTRDQAGEMGQAIAEAFEYLADIKTSQEESNC